MKKLFFYAVLALLPAALFGQRWYIGPELGMNLIPTQKSDLGQDFQLGWHAGVNAEFYFNENFSLRSGIFATQKKQYFEGFDSSQVNTFGLEDALGLDGVNLYSYTATERTVSEFYLELPLMAAYNLGPVSFYGGPYVSYLFSARTKETRNITTPFLQAIDIGSFIDDPTGGLLDAFLPPASETIFDESSSRSGLQTIDTGIKAGIRYDMNRLGINVYYQYGVLDYQTIAKPERDVHDYVQLTLNYNFGLGSKTEHISRY